MAPLRYTMGFVDCNSLELTLTVDFDQLIPKGGLLTQFRRDVKQARAWMAAEEIGLDLIANAVGSVGVDSRDRDSLLL